ncbi:uncharacterized protein DSM5745_05210 [Aspergillus mulundensis]|uniref:Uncharacterized protein n=1 Tax=Aspergillus mulundensis TaxID=1810919 RepID=A0A3D8S5R8_9EURO|nr:Uncharacterized protein DSM5745_05210 [Aspergillus mulundensis]RDW81653.1 Uncharacterized protein DSM5745_05210 [Aspergillus mulundensis]
MSDHEKRGSSDDNRPANAQRRPDKNDNASADSSQDVASLGSRIQQSASGLARNAFFSSASSGDTAHLLSDNGKATPSSSSSALAAAEQYGQVIGPPSSSSRDPSAHGPAETFRSAPTTQSGGFELPGLTEDQFQNTYGGDLSETIDPFDAGKGKGKGKATASSVPRSESESAHRTSTYHDEATAASTLIPSDGDAVVSILTDQTFDPEFPPSANEPPEYLETELSPPQLTPAEIQMIESFRRQLPPDVQRPQQSQTQLNSLSLVPDIGSFLDAIPAASATHATALRDTVLASLPGAAEWVSVEEKYHDEVWGYLQPTLEAAVKEIESSRDSAGAADGPAVRRLKMILKHMQH